jgi:hypothetical protein
MRSMEPIKVIIKTWYSQRYEDLYRRIIEVHSTKKAQQQILNNSFQTVMIYRTIGLL